MSEPPISGPPRAPWPDQPVSAQPAGAQPDPFGADWRPRITPTPKPSRKQVVRAGVGGVLAGLVVFGSAGYAVGHLTGGAAPPALPRPSASPTLPAFERNQLTRSQVLVTGDLAKPAAGWLPYVSSCARSGEPGGPRLADGEATKVSCRYGAANVYFVQYRSLDERDKARARYQPQNIDAKQLAPGVVEGATNRGTPSGRARGGYVEFAFKASSEPNARTVSGIWWDDAGEPVGMYLLAFWDDVGQHWDPLRDVWSRYS